MPVNENNYLTNVYTTTTTNPIDPLDVRNIQIPYNITDYTNLCIDAKGFVEPYSIGYITKEEFEKAIERIYNLLKELKYVDITEEDFMSIVKGEKEI